MKLRVAIASLSIGILCSCLAHPAAAISYAFITLGSGRAQAIADTPGALEMKATGVSVVVQNLPPGQSVEVEGRFELSSLWTEG